VPQPPPLPRPAARTCPAEPWCAASSMQAGKAIPHSCEEAKIHSSEGCRSGVRLSPSTQRVERRNA
jgi:hypothetical protein